jgi:hypothetical protein
MDVVDDFEDTDIVEMNSDGTSGNTVLIKLIITVKCIVLLRYDVSL